MVWSNRILSKNQKIFNDILDVLYSDPDKAEDEILEEIAPQYGMTAEELKNFMYEYMDAYYDYMDNLNKEQLITAACFMGGGDSL